MRVALQQGAVKALVILGMVASSSRDFTLVRAGPVQLVASAGQRRSAAHWQTCAYWPRGADKGRGHDDLRVDCSIALRQLSGGPFARAQMTSPGVLSVLIKLATLELKECQRNCARALFNLARNAELRTVLTKAGVVSVFKQLSEVEDMKIAELCVSGIAMLSSHPLSRVQIVEQHADRIIFDSAKEGPRGGWPNDEMEFGAVLTLYNLSWHEETRHIIVGRGAVKAIAQPFRSEDAETRKIAVQSLHNLADDPENLMPLMGARADVLVPLRYLACDMQLETDFEPGQLCAAAQLHVVLNLTTKAETHVALVSHGVTGILWSMYRTCAESMAKEGPMVASRLDTMAKTVDALINILASKVNTAQVVREGGGQMLIKYAVAQKFDVEPARAAQVADAQRRTSLVARAKGDAPPHLDELAEPNDRAGQRRAAGQGRSGQHLARVCAVRGQERGPECVGRLDIIVAQC